MTPIPELTESEARADLRDAIAGLSVLVSGGLIAWPVLYYVAFYIVTSY